MPLEDFAVPGIGAAFSIVDGAIQRGRSKRDLAAQRKWFIEDREYNSPKNQLARIHEAGLPSAAYFGGSASSQSDVFSGGITPSTETGLGEVGEQIGKYHSNRMTRIATEAAEQNLAILKNQRKISDVETQDALSLVPDMDRFQAPKEGQPLEVYQHPRVIEAKRGEEKLGKANLAAKELENDIKGIEYEIKNATTDQEIKMVQEKLDKMIQDRLLQIENVKSAQTENKYKDSELEYRQTIRDLRKAFWGKLRSGNMPSFREILNILMLALENRLD